GAASTALRKGWARLRLLLRTDRVISHVSSFFSDLLAILARMGRRVKAVRVNGRVSLWGRLVDQAQYKPGWA
ncbi:MAG: hypothetical protein ACP5HG_15485, partial [Anaerolineae bacterium]